MSSSLFIVPVDPSAWNNPDDTSEKPTSDFRIDLVEFSKKLHERWFGAGVSIPPGPYYVLEWKLPPEGGLTWGLEGGLQSDQQSVSIYRPFSQTPSFSAFVLWYRSFVPANYRLFLHSEGSWDQLELTPDTTAQEIDKFTGYAR